MRTPEQKKLHALQSRRDYWAKKAKGKKTIKAEKLGGKYKVTKIIIEIELL